MHSHPMIEEAAVISIPDPVLGQEPRAIVVVKKDKEACGNENMVSCRAKLAGFKRPKSVVFVDALPRNPMGKILKKGLRERYGHP